MNALSRSRAALGAAGLLALALSGAGGTPADRTPPDRSLPRVPGPAEEGPAATRRMEAALDEWPPDSRALARAIAEEYGAPDEVRAEELRWSRRAPWRKIVVFRDRFSADRPDRLLQSVSYAAPYARLPALGSFGHGVSYDPLSGELAARSDGQPTNRLALNLADEIVRERRSVASAAAFYDAALSLSYSGKSSPYLDRLLFRFASP